MSENYYHNRTYIINWYMRENLAARICLLMLYARKFSCAKICTFTVAQDNRIPQRSEHRINFHSPAATLCILKPSLLQGVNPVLSKSSSLKFPQFYSLFSNFSSSLVFSFFCSRYFPSRVSRCLNVLSDCVVLPAKGPEGLYIPSGDFPPFSDGTNGRGRSLIALQVNSRTRGS